MGNVSIDNCKDEEFVSGKCTAFHSLQRSVKNIPDTIESGSKVLVLVTPFIYACNAVLHRSSIIIAVKVKAVFSLS